MMKDRGVKNDRGIGESTVRCKGRQKDGKVVKDRETEGSTVEIQKKDMIEVMCHLGEA